LGYEYRTSIYPIPLAVVNLKFKKMSVVKVLEVMSNSTKSWEDATQNAVLHASKTVKHIKSVWIQDQSALVQENKIIEYRVTVKMSFEIEHHEAK
jgi:flavin-binding protein dodecin